MADKLLPSFGAHVKGLRLKKKLSQAALAHKGNFDRNYIGMIERGERNPSLKTLKRLADTLEIDLATLLKFKS